MLQLAGQMDLQGTWLQLGGSFELGGGAITGMPQLRNTDVRIAPGAVGAASLQLQGACALTGDIAPAQTVNIHGISSGSHATTTIGADGVNDGLILLDSSSGGWSANLVVAPGSTLTNQGSLRVEVGTGGVRSLTGSFVNQGAIELTDTTTFGGTGSLENQSSLVVGAGETLTLQAGATVRQLAGTLDVQGVYSQLGGSFELGGGVLSGLPRLRATALTIPAGSTATGGIEVEGTSCTLSGDIENGQTLIVRGRSAASHGTLTATAPFANRGEIVLESESGGWQSNLVVPGALVNEGALRSLNGSGGARTLGLELDNRGSLEVQRATTLGMAAADHRNSGSLIAGSGAVLTVTGSSFTNQPGGVIEGEGRIDFRPIGGLANGGTIRPAGSGATGRLDLDGDMDCAATSRIEIEIGGYTPGADFDLLDVSGILSLDGALAVRPAAGFQPQLGDTFLVITAASIRGDFALTDLGGLPKGWLFDSRVVGNGVEVTIVPAPGHIGPAKRPLVLEDPNPGLANQLNDFALRGAVPGSGLQLFAGGTSGSTAVPGCPGVFLDIAAAQGVATTLADDRGRATFQWQVPLALSGQTVLFQAGEAGTCRTSNLVIYSFP